MKTHNNPNKNISSLKLGRAQQHLQSVQNFKNAIPYAGEITPQSQNNRADNVSGVHIVTK